MRQMFERQRSLGEKKKRYTSNIYQLVGGDGSNRKAQAHGQKHSIFFLFIFRGGDDNDDNDGGKHFRHLQQIKAIANFHFYLCFSLIALE